MPVISASAFAGEADIVGVDWSVSANGSLTISATVLHADEGWEHFADAFDVRDENGNLLKTRILAHPHVNEQPFTRQLSGVEVPEGTCELIISAHDSVHEYGGNNMTINICDTVE